MKLNSTRQKRKLLVYIIGVVLLVSWVVSITLLLPSSYKNDTSAGASISDAHAASFSLYKSARSNDCRQVAPSGATCIYPVNRGLTNGRYYMYECVDGWCWFNYPCL